MQQQGLQRYLVTIVTATDSVHILTLEGNSFADVEKQALLFPTIKAILQISMYN